MTLRTLQFLRDLVGRQQLSADNPDIVEIAILIRDVRQELDRAIEMEKSAAVSSM